MDPISSKLKIEVPNHFWIGEISRLFPYHHFEFVTAMPLQLDEMITQNLFVIQGSNLDTVLTAINSHSALVSCTVVKQTATELTLMLVTRGHILLYTALKHQILIKFPVKIDANRIELNIVGDRTDIDHFIDELTQRGLNVDLRNIGPYEGEQFPTHLTPRQQYLFQKARSSGYYDSPRKITLSELAKREQLSKSTLSLTLQRIHKKLLGN